MRDAGIAPIGMTLCALNVAMRAFERKLRLRMIELLCDLPERRRRRMTARTVGAETAIVRVLVTGRAIGRQAEIGPRFVAALACEGMSPFEREPGLRAVIEFLRIKGAQLGVTAGMLDVTGDAAFARITVHAFLHCDPLRNRLMAGQASRGGDLTSLFVTADAIRRSFQVCVGTRERAGGDELSQLRRGDVGDEHQQDDEKRNGFRANHDRYPPNGV